MYYQNNPAPNWGPAAKAKPHQPAPSVKRKVETDDAAFVAKVPKINGEGASEIA